MKKKLPDVKDLRKKYPRSPAEYLGGFVLLARMLDKCRATVAGTHGEYKFNCPLDQRFFGFTGINADELRKVVALGRSDAQVAAWVKRKTANLSADEISAWNFDMIHREPQLVNEKAHFESYRAKHSPHRPYIRTWFQMLDAEEGRI